jgi:hypothetical protein
MHKEVKRIVRDLERNGYTVVTAGGSPHPKVKRRGKTLASLPLTPGGGRWRENLLCELRRRGIDI